MSSYSSPKIFPAIEILSAILSCKIKFPHVFIADPRAFIYSHLNIESSPEIDIKAVANDAHQVHLALPYYSNLQNCAEMLADDDFADVSGGDITVLAVFATVLGGLILTGAAGGATATLGVQLVKK